MECAIGQQKRENRSESSWIVAAQDASRAKTAADVGQRLTFGLTALPRTVPILALLDDWLRHHRARSSAKSPLGETLAYIAKYRDGLGRLLTDGRVEIDSNTVERTIRPIALSRKNALVVGHDGGAENWAAIASLIETCKMNVIDPHTWLASTLTAIVNGHKQSQIDDLLPWNYTAKV